ncbi:hypothetical protein Tco_1264251 [Tanacetum coccineum]
MSELPDDAIGIYHRMFDFSGVPILFSSFLLALIKRYRVHFSQLAHLGLNKTLCKHGDWFSFTKRRAPSVVCIDDNRSFMKHWKSGFFLIDRRAIPDSMAWRHPSAAIDDPRPAVGSFSMVDVRRLSAHVIKLRDVLEGVLIFSRLPFYCTPAAAADVVIPDPTPEDLFVGTLSAKILAKVEASQKRKTSTSGATLSHVAKRTSKMLLFLSYLPEDLFVGTLSAKILAKVEASQKRKASTSGATSSHVAKRTSDDNDACVEILLVTPIRPAALIPSLGNQGGSSAAPAAEGPSTRDSQGKGIMVNDAAAPSAGASRPRPSSGPAPLFNIK